MMVWLYIAVRKKAEDWCLGDKLKAIASLSLSLYLSLSPSLPLKFKPIVGKSFKSVNSLNSETVCVLERVQDAENIPPQAPTRLQWLLKIYPRRLILERFSAVDGEGRPCVGLHRD